MSTDTTFVPIQEQFLDNGNKFADATVAEPGVTIDATSMGIHFEVGEDGQNRVSVSHIDGQVQDPSLKTAFADAPKVADTPLPEGTEGSDLVNNSEIVLKDPVI